MRNFRLDDEGGHQEALFEWAAYQAGRMPELEFLHHVPNGGKRDKATAAALKRQGVRAGVPDIVLPAARAGWHGLYIELKAGKNTTTGSQKRWLGYLCQQGYYTAVCYGCLCRNCLNTCCDRKHCGGKKESCGNYRGFRQLSIFESQPQPKGTPRYSWQYYGITKERYKQLTGYIQSGRYDALASQAARRANETIAEYILLSVTQNKSYDALRVKWELKEMEWIPYCRTDFYGVRRYFYHLFDLEVRRIGK